MVYLSQQIVHYPVDGPESVELEKASRLGAFAYPTDTSGLTLDMVLW